jgi:hypothetical protein
MQIGGVAYFLSLNLTYICAQMILNKYFDFVEKMWLDFIIFCEGFFGPTSLPFINCVVFSYCISNMLTSHARLPLQHLLYYVNFKSLCNMTFMTLVQMIVQNC